MELEALTVALFGDGPLFLWAADVGRGRTACCGRAALPCHSSSFHILAHGRTNREPSLGFFYPIHWAWYMMHRCPGMM